MPRGTTGSEGSDSIMLTGAFYVLGLLTAAAVVVRTCVGGLTANETALFQLLGTTFTTLGAFRYGKQRSRDAAAEALRPHARSSVRRLVSLGLGLRRMAELSQQRRMELARDTSWASERVVDLSMDSIESHIGGLLSMASDAVEDWADFLPEEVERIRGRAAPDAEEVANG